MLKEIVVCLFLVVPTLAVSIAFITLANIYSGTACDHGTVGMTLPVYLLVYGVVDLFFAFLFIGSFILFLRKIERYYMLAAVTIVMDIIFSIVWTILVVLVSDNAAPCNVQLNIMWSMIWINGVFVLMGTLIWYVLERFPQRSQ